jgi:DNA-binding YbaB/EbfC family protein
MAKPFDLGGMGNILEQARTMQDRLQVMQEEVGSRIVEGTAGGGMVRVEVSGKLEIRRITIEESVYADNDREMLQDLVAAGVNDAIRKAQKMMADEMTQLTGGISLPGFG